MDARVAAPSPRTVSLRLRERIEAHSRLLEAAALATAIVILCFSVLPNLANHPTLTDDESWVMSASYKLAEEGVFGTDMFRGFFHADTHYYFNMPAHHVVVAGSFKLLGAGVIQARLPGLIYAVATLLLSYLIARRVFGLAAAMLTLGLLLFLRLNMGFDTGLPLQELASNMRYDLAPVPFMLGAVLVLLGGKSMLRAALAGLLAGIAVLMQFYGAFLVPPLLLFILTWQLPPTRRLALSGALIGAALLVGLPYGAYILSSPDDFRGQAGTIDRRADFNRPSFYINNLLHEPDRFIRPLAFKEVPRGADHALVSPQWLSLQETLTRRPSAKAAVLFGLPLAIGYLAYRALRQLGEGERLLLFCLAGLVLQYALFESAKFYIYWLPVVPFLCIGIAAVCVAFFRNATASRLRFAFAGATALVLLVFLAEGSVARLGGIRTARDATNYETLATTIHQYVPPGSNVVGSTSLWWGLHDTDYRSYFLFFYLTRPDAEPYKTSIPQFLADDEAQYLVLTRLAIGELEKYLSPRDYQDWQAYMQAHATKVARIEGPVVIGAYGFIDIWRFDR